MPKPNSSNFIQENAWFLAGCALFLWIGGIVLGNTQTGDLIMYCSDHRSAFGDFFFRYVTKMGEEPAYLVAIGILLFYGYRYALFIPFLGIVVTLISFGSKAYFKHPRPMAYYQDLGIFDQINLVQHVELHGGPTSYPSGHTMSAFALYAFISFCLPHKKWIGLFLFIIAFLIGFSRIYIVQHFMKDIYLGAIMGLGIAVAFYWLQGHLSNDSNKWWNKSLSIG